MKSFIVKIIYCIAEENLSIIKCFHSRNKAFDIKNHKIICKTSEVMALLRESSNHSLVIYFLNMQENSI